MYQLKYSKVLYLLLITVIFITGCVEYPTATVAPDVTATIAKATQFPTPTQIVQGTITPEPTNSYHCAVGEYDNTQYKVVVSTVVRVRLEPHLQSKIVGHLQTGEIITAKCRYEKSDKEVWLLTSNDLWIAQVFNNILLERVE